MATTLKDVAERCGVSIKTVSNVVNGNLARVSPQTAERIRASLAELNYLPNLAARHLRKGQAGAIAIAIPDLANPYFSSLCETVMSAADRRGYTVLIEPTAGDRHLERLALKGLSRHVIDGMILIPLALDMDDIQSDGPAVPVVLLGERLFAAALDHVAIDNVAAARVATQHLIDLGRRRIGAIGAPVDAGEGMALLRLQGYREALQNAGHEVAPELIAPGPLSAVLYNRASGVEAMRYLLDLGTPLDAVFCFNDLLALGAMKALHLAGRRIPDDVAVIGFDDIEDSRYAIPSLSTITPDRDAIAEAALTSLEARIHHDEAPPRLLQPPFHLTVRGSTAGREREIEWSQAPET